MSKYVVGDRNFERKEDLVREVQSILYGHEMGEFLGGPDFDFIYSLLVERHSDPDRKIGCGVAGIFVDQNDYGGRGFFVERSDGSRTDFSYRKCIFSKGPLCDIRVACRTAVRPDIVSFRERYFRENAGPDGRVECSLTQEKVSASECHVDHAPPDTFNKIFLNWIKEFGIDPEKIEISGYDDGEMGKKFRDPTLAESFRKFHGAHARLRVTSASGNLSASRIENREEKLEKEKEKSG